MHLDELRLLAGQLSLDFVNSIEDRAGAEPLDFLTSYAEVVRWSRHAGIFTADEAAALLEAAARDERGATAVHAQVLGLRETLHRIFLAIATGQEPGEADLSELRRVYADAISHARLRHAAGHFTWEWLVDGRQLEQVLWPLAHAAVELLTEGDLRRVKECANPHGCGWLFYDGSKNGSRRWCSMEGCGSQVKMRRQYARQRAARVT